MSTALYTIVKHNYHTITEYDADTYARAVELCALVGTRVVYNNATGDAVPYTEIDADVDQYLEQCTPPQEAECYHCRGTHHTQQCWDRIEGL